VIAGAAVLPTAPLLVPGVTAAIPDGLARTVRAARAVVAGLPAHDVAILVTAARPGARTATGAPADDGEARGVHPGGTASLAAIAHAELTTTAPPAPALARALGAATGLPLVTPPAPLPLGAAVLAHLLHPASPTPPVETAGPLIPYPVSRPDAVAGMASTPAAGGCAGAAARTRTGHPDARSGPAAADRAVTTAGAGRSAVVAVVVPAHLEGAALTGLGESVVSALAGVRAVVVAAGDLSAGLTPKAPLALVEGAAAWDERVVDAASSGRLDRVARLGPGEARRVGSLGWAPLVVLAGILACTRLGLVVRSYAAPRGVGYLVAAGA